MSVDQKQEVTVKKFGGTAVAKVFAAYPKRLRTGLMFLRELIFRTAARIDGVGPLEETLKWGQPSYLTRASESGSTIRIDAIRAQPDAYAMYFHCQTTLVPTFREKFGSTFRYEGNRALVFSTGEKIPVAELADCIALALTYHLQKQSRRTPIRHRIR